MSRYEIPFPNVSSPKVSSAPNCELLLKAIETMKRDVASVEQNRWGAGGGSTNKIVFWEHLYEIKMTPVICGRLISLENNRDPTKPSHTKFLGAGERHFTYL